MRRFFIIYTAALLGLASGAFALPHEGSKSRSQGIPIGSPRSLELNELGVKAVRAGNLTLAEGYFAESLKDDPHNVTAVYNLAGMLLTNSKPGEAVSLLKKYITKVPDDGGLHARLGDAYFSTKNIDDAEREYETALKIDPEVKGVSSKLGTIYTISNRLKDAEVMLLKAVDEDPHNGEKLGNLAALFYAEGKNEEAISTAKRGLQVQPSSKLYLTLGTAYEATKDFKSALISFQRAADLGASSPELSERMELLKKAAN